MKICDVYRIPTCTDRIVNSGNKEEAGERMEWMGNQKGLLTNERIGLEERKLLVVYCCCCWRGGGEKVRK